MSLLPVQIQKTIEEFSKLPGIGPKSAERLTFHLLRSSKASPEALGQALQKLKNELLYCATCQMVTTPRPGSHSTGSGQAGQAGECLCEICCTSSRDHSTILVVENPLDVVAFEKTSYKGVYHVLHGVLSPIDGMGPEQLKLKELIDRAKSGGIQEVILAMNPDVEGEATAGYIRNKLSDSVQKITRLAHGLPMGADIEFADQGTLREALAGRRNL